MYTFPCTDCGAPTVTKLFKPRRCDKCRKEYINSYSRWLYENFRKETLAYHRAYYWRNRERISAQRKARKEGETR